MQDIVTNLRYMVAGPSGLMEAEHERRTSKMRFDLRIRTGPPEIGSFYGYVASGEGEDDEDQEPIPFFIWGWTREVAADGSIVETFILLPEEAWQAYPMQ